MKLVLRTLALSLALGTVAVASSNPNCGTKRFTGFYTGLQVGISSTTSKSAPIGGQDVRAGGLGYVGGLHAGYGMGFGNLGYVGFTGFANLGSTKLVANNDAGVQFKRTYDFGANVDVGVLTNGASSTLIGVGLGVEWARYKVKTANSVDDSSAVVESKSKNVTKVSFVPSLFARTFLTKNVYLGLRGSVGFGSKIKTDGFEVAKNTRNLRTTVEVGYKF